MKVHDFKHPFKHQASLQAPSYTTSLYAFHRLRINWGVQATTKTLTGMSETKKRSRSQSLLRQAFSSQPGAPLHHKPVPAIVPDWHTEAAGLHNDMLRIAVRIYLHSCMPLAKREETSLPGVGDASTQNCCVCLKSTHKRQRSRNQMHKCSL